MKNNRNLKGCTALFRSVVGAVGIVSLLLASGCAQTAAEGTGSSSSAGAVLNVIEPSDGTNACIDPFQAITGRAKAFVRNYAESLLDQDPETGELKPWLAKDYKVSDDDKTYTFTLKDGITFSDGEQFNADAVVKNFEEILKVVQENPAASNKNYVRNLESVSKVDDSTVEFHLSAPNAAFPQALATTTTAILSPKSFEKDAKARCLANNVGTGPYVVEKFDVKTGSVLSKRTGYNSPSPFAGRSGDAYLDEIRIAYSNESSVRLGNFLSGKADVIWNGNDEPFVQNDVNQIKQKNGEVVSRSAPGTSYDLITNTSEGRPLADENVRRAVGLAIDRTVYASTVIREGYPVVKGVVDVSTPGAVDTPSLTKTDAGEAGDLLDKAGWKLGDDGYRYKDGKKLSIVYLTQSRETGAELIQDELKKVGIDYQIKVVTFAQTPGIFASGDYDITSVTVDRADPSALMQLIDARVAGFKSLAEKAASGQEQSELQGLFDQSEATSDSAARLEVYKQIQALVESKALLIPVFERQQDAAVSSKVQGLRFTADSLSDFYNVKVNG